MKVSASTDVAYGYLRLFRGEHKGHPTSPHVVPAGATSGDISLRAGVETSAIRGVRA